MLQLTIPGARFFDERTEEFILYKPITLKLEHSLISIQKWESKWHKSYLSAKEFTAEEFRDYVRCMCLDSSVPSDTFLRLTRQNVLDIRAYIEDPMTATTFGKTNGKGPKQAVTAEIVYYWMVSYGIPFECAKWHINQLMTLIKVCGIKNSPKKAGNRKEAAASRQALNRARRARLGTSG